MHTYFPTGVCSRQMNIEIDENGIIKNCEIIGGCAGNTFGICQLVKGMNAEEAVKRLKGIDCRGRGTSCPTSFQSLLKKLLKKFNNRTGGAFAPSFFVLFSYIELF